ncbi:MAG: group II intron reverse transcriptase/maturase [Legionella sp.]|nr:group II intron reverse transcriptase/maturase [Legionella sp.]
MEKTKPFNISKKLFVQAHKLVKANAGAAGVDHESLEDFERNLKNNLYKLWNRMSSGSYFPPPVKAVPIPKKSGGERILGVPTVADRIAQMVIKLIFEPKVESCFLPDSYGYRPNKSALDAVGITRQRCWKYDWILEYDIRGLFDNLDHSLLMKAVRKHTDDKLVTLYIERWLKTPLQLPNGSLQEKTRGVMQGGVISPVLSNLFLHYVFDIWMKRNHPNVPWCRYADDGLAHCNTEEEAKQLLSELTNRFKECGLELHPDKTKIVYCKDGNRRQNQLNKSFDFLGYEFRARGCKNNKTGEIFTGFVPAASKPALKSMRATIRESNLRNRTDIELNEIARWFNPILQGWLNYYGKYNRSALYRVWRHFNKTLVAWAMRKYKSLGNSKTKASKFLRRIAEKQKSLFVHWRAGMVGTFI